MVYLQETFGMPLSTHESKIIMDKKIKNQGIEWDCYTKPLSYIRKSGQGTGLQNIQDNFFFHRAVI